MTERKLLREKHLKERERKIELKRDRIEGSE